MRAVIGGALAAGLLVSPAFAQSSSGTWNGLSDRFQIDTGYFRINANTVLDLLQLVPRNLALVRLQEHPLDVDDRHSRRRARLSQSRKRDRGDQE